MPLCYAYDTAEPLSKKRDIWMDDKKEKLTGVVAYLSYVRIL